MATRVCVPWWAAVLAEKPRGSDGQRGYVGMAGLYCSEAPQPSSKRVDGAVRHRKSLGAGG